MQLIYIKGPKGPEPQLLHVEAYSAAGKALEPLAKFDIPEDEQHYKLHVLTALYPLPSGLRRHD